MTIQQPSAKATDPNRRSQDAVITVLVADDHPVVREGLANMVRQQDDMKVVAEVANGAEALDEWIAYRPDVTLVDLRMPKLDGADTITRIREIDASARVIVLTIYDSEEDLFRAIQAGARAYLLKDATRVELLDCIRRVSRGEFCISGELAQKLAARVGLPQLTNREREVLQLAARGHSNKQIASTLAIGDGTVKAHLKSIFFKLDALSRTEAVTIAHRRGIIDL